MTMKLITKAWISLNKKVTEPWFDLKPNKYLPFYVKARVSFIIQCPQGPERILKWTWEIFGLKILSKEKVFLLCHISRALAKLYFHIEVNCTEGVNSIQKKVWPFNHGAYGSLGGWRQEDKWWYFLSTCFDSKVVPCLSLFLLMFSKIHLTLFLYIFQN